MNAISNVEIMYSEMTQAHIVVSDAPTRFICAAKASAASSPRMPPAGNVPAIGRQSGSRPTAVQVAVVQRIPPVTFAQGEVIADERTHFQPSNKIRIGKVYAERQKA